MIETVEKDLTDGVGEVKGRGRKLYDSWEQIFEAIDSLDDDEDEDKTILEEFKGRVRT